MGLLKGLRDVVGFLTIIPVRLDEKSLQNAADHMFLFPAVGGFLGLLAGCAAYLLSKVFPEIIVGALVVFFLLALTGFHHVDGLLDFGDGLIFQGTPEKKIRVMRDSRVGVGGLILGLMVILVTLLCVSKLPQSLIVQCLVASEASAKLSMVILASAGRSACKGVGMCFVEVMHGRQGIPRLTVAVVITFALGLFLLEMKFVYVVLASVATGLVMLAISNRQFKGVTGDVFGATNEVSRMASLLALLAVV
jgi:adenosylcobinamide-GDP ribazoletransferase